MGIWIARLLMDATLLTFAAFKSFQQWQQGWSSSIINLLVQDNVLAFVFLLSVQILNLTLEGVVQPQATLAGIGYAIAADVIIGTRLLLHTREVMYAADDPGSVQLTEFIVRPELDLAERTQVSLGDDILGLPRLAIMPEEAEEDRHTYGEVTPIEEGDSARALVFRKRS
ncbi:hypothetical protein CALVIDRAFT_534782 [Calocera viscosa TUFC12733]|uniref:Uncharacterized protein n=1 Tax=Calocera viscosa (strain TUFC12733) TaxID=1330018 RepID=A0A167PYC5_CALVF|nr:hypothetical protein CALVIDRAFT_534782 [Calocera viscosa TUFC12733]